VCGDGVVQAPERCDDHKNDGSYGGCTMDCQHAAYCGDGVKNGSEECDYGSGNASIANATYASCLENCQLGPHCGDGVVQSLEQCDDKGPSSSCSANCMQVIPAR
jgi:cysteine-rich repeat protein